MPRWLQVQERLSDETLKFARAHRTDDVQRLLLGHAPAGVNVAEAVTQIEGWRAASHKLPTWAACENIIYPPRLAMEQCSSEATARYKASLIARRADFHGLTSFTDLTGGFGVDCAYMGELFGEVTYVERNPSLCTIGASNFAALGLTQIHVVQGDAADVLEQLPVQDWIYLDPARRDAGGRKVVSLSNCEPDVVKLEPALLRHARRVMIKCSPMLDIRLAASQLISSIHEVHVVSVQNECKELLLLTSDAPVIHAVCLQNDGSVESDFTFTSAEEQACDPVYADSLGCWLYEPNAALLKAGCFKLPAKRYHLQKLHPNSQLYTSDVLRTDFPGRVFEVVETLGFSKQELKRLSSLGRANVAVRNFPSSVEELRRRLHLSDGGDDYIFATTTKSGQKILVRCQKVQK